MNNQNKTRDKKGRFVKQSKSAEQIVKEVETKKRKAEQEEIERMTKENPAELCEDAEPMQFETPEGSPTEEEQGTGIAIAIAMALILAVFASIVWCLLNGVFVPLP